MFPAASQIIFGINALAIRADFSLSTIATDLSGYNVNRCSPKKHCCKLKSSGNDPDFLSLLCTQSIAPLACYFSSGRNCNLWFNCSRIRKLSFIGYYLATCNSRFR